jgi:integrase
MARIKPSPGIGTREKRRDLKASREPYWQVIERGLSLGYRKTKEGGAWTWRQYDAKRRKHAEGRLGTADDHRDADGVEVLSYSQAQRKLLADTHQGALRSSGQLYTVADAARDYVGWQRVHRKTPDLTQAKLRAYVLPHLGDKLLANLTPKDFETWLDLALKFRRAAGKPKAKKRKAKAGLVVTEEPKPVPPTAEELADRQRRRKATVNRVINALKGMLNHAHKNGKVASRDAWARLPKFRSADSARTRWLTVDEATRLQNACAPDFRALVRAGLLSGCRPSELLAMRCGDFDPQSQTVLVADSKSGKPRRVPLTDDGVSLFEELTAGKPAASPVFTRADGSAWYRTAIIRAMNQACTAGKISPAATFYTLRHTYASHLVQQGTPLLFVASALGHRDARMAEKHYAHLGQSDVADMIRAKLPSFGAEPKGKVVALRPRAARRGTHGK